MPRPRGSVDDIESRRQRGLALLDEGLSINEVGRLLGCAPSSVMRWRNLRDSHGQSGLKVRVPIGSVRRLTREDGDALIIILKKGGLANGFETNDWTRVRIQQIIERTFGITYHAAHISRIMAHLGWRHDDETGWFPPQP